MEQVGNFTVTLGGYVDVNLFMFRFSGALAIDRAFLMPDFVTSASICIAAGPLTPFLIATGFCTHLLICQIYNKYTVSHRTR